MTKVAGIYKIQRIGTDQCYVGSSVDIALRWTKHVNALKKGVHHASRLQNAWAKHGQDMFAFSVLEECANDKGLLKAREQYWMDVFHPVFNTLPAAYSAAGYSHTPEARKKIGAAGIGRKRTPEAIAKTVALRTGAKHSAEIREKISAAVKGRVHTPASIEKRAAALRGISLSAEHREKIGLAHKGKTMSDDAKRKMSEAKKGKKRTPEAIEKTAAAHRGKKHSPETIEKIRAKLIGRQLSPESIEKRRLTILARQERKRAEDISASQSGICRPLP